MYIINTKTYIHIYTLRLRRWRWDDSYQAESPKEAKLRAHWRLSAKRRGVAEENRLLERGRMPAIGAHRRVNDGGRYRMSG